MERLNRLERVARALDHRLKNGADVVEAVLAVGESRQWGELVVSGVNGILGRIAEVTEVFPLVADEMSSMIYYSEQSAWTIRRLSRQRTGRTAYADGVVVNCGRDPVLLELVRLSPEIGNDLYDARAAVIAHEEIEICPNSVMAISDWRSIYRLSGNSPGRSVLCIDRPFTQDYVWTYDFDDRRCVGFNSSNGADTSVESVIDILASTGKPEAIELLTIAADHRLHHIRWQAVLRLMDISPDHARLVCEPMLGDPHPRIRELAGKLIQMVRSREVGACPCP